MAVPIMTVLLLPPSESCPKMLAFSALNTKQIETTKRYQIYQSYLQKPSKFTISIWNVITFFAFFFITKCTNDITKCKQALVDMNSYLDDTWQLLDGEDYFRDTTKR
ncbi:hypothetical protein V6Z11_A06G022600 [Gossypium hirsutum]